MGPLKIIDGLGWYERTAGSCVGLLFWTSSRAQHTPQERHKYPNIIPSTVAVAQTIRTHAFSIDIAANDESLLSITVDRWKVLISSSWLKLRSAPHSAGASHIRRNSSIYWFVTARFPGFRNFITEYNNSLQQAGLSTGIAFAHQSSVCAHWTVHRLPQAWLYIPEQQLGRECAYSLQQSRI